MFVAREDQYRQGDSGIDGVLFRGERAEPSRGVRAPRTEAALQQCVCAIHGEVAVIDSVPEKCLLDFVALHERADHAGRGVAGDGDAPALSREGYRTGNAREIRRT